jgi:hypothetical protein
MQLYAERSTQLAYQSDSSSKALGHPSRLTALAAVRGDRSPPAAVPGSTGRTAPPPVLGARKAAAAKIDAHNCPRIDVRSQGQGTGHTQQRPRRLHEQTPKVDKGSFHIS